MKGDLCAYMLQESRVREDAACRRKQAAFALPAKTSRLGHAVPVINVHPSHDGTAVTVGEDGVICCWSSELKLQKTKDAFVGLSKSKKRPKLAESYKCWIFGLNNWIRPDVSAAWRVEQEVKVGE